MTNIGNGNKGKFSERLKKMRITRAKKSIQLEDSEIMYKNFMKVVAVIPLVVADNVFVKDKKILNSDKKENSKNINDNANEQDSLDIFNNEKNNISISEKKKINRDKINSIDVSLIKNIQNKIVNNHNKMYDINNKETKINSDIKIKETDTYVKQLEKKIINLIKKDLIKTVNELEILESELYLLSQVNGDEKTVVKCRENLNEVKKILCKIDKLKEKYDYLKDNYDFEYLFEIDNNELIDTIIELKNKFSKNEVIATVEDYKLLEVYKYLYLTIDQIHEDTVKFEEEKKKQELELQDRDIDFKKLKNDVYNVDYINNSYVSFVNKQNEFLKNLDNEISKINSYEVVNYRLKGFGTYLVNSFKYLGLLMVNPLRGFIPSIATQTLITRNVVGNLYRNLKWEENKKMVYEAIDYSSSIYNAISDLESTDRMVDATLDDIIKLKMEYNDKFKIYQGDFLEYRDIIRKINDMENKILGNKMKIEIMKTRMKEYEKENEKKLKLVKKLNDKENGNN